MKTISIIIPSNRSTIKQTLKSLDGQLKDGDEVIVVRDEETRIPYHDSKYVKYLKDTSIGDPVYGYKARQWGLERAEGDWIHIIGDDDVYMPEAIETMRLYAEENKIPALFRMKRSFHWHDIIWSKPDLELGNNIAGEMFFFPNFALRMGTFGTDYCADNKFIRETVRKYKSKTSEGVNWIPAVICDWGKLRV